jgi:hypothetical protein
MLILEEENATVPFSLLVLFSWLNLPFAEGKLNSIQFGGSAFPRRTVGTRGEGAIHEECGAFLFSSLVVIEGIMMTALSSPLSLLSLPPH